MSPATLRRAVRADLARLIEIRASVRENRLADPASVMAADYESFLDRALVHVADRGDLVLGFSAAELTTGTVWALFVDPAHEGRGLGRRLLDAALADLAAAGRRTARLTTDPDTRAARFYRSAGWACRGQTAAGEVIFEKRLHAPGA